MAALSTYNILTKSSTTLIDLCRQNDTKKPSRWSLCPQKSDDTCLSNTIKKMMSLHKFFLRLTMTSVFTCCFTSTYAALSRNTSLDRPISATLVVGTLAFIAMQKIKNSLEHLVATYNPYFKKNPPPPASNR